jgi:hypothetical protein
LQLTAEWITRRARNLNMGSGDQVGRVKFMIREFPDRTLTRN